MDENLSDQVEIAKDEPLGLETDYTPMRPEQPNREKTFESDADGIKAAAKEVSKRRGQEPEPIERQYVTLVGENAGERRPANETVTAAEAADDLTKIRALEAREFEDLVT